MLCKSNFLVTQLQINLLGNVFTEPLWYSISFPLCVFDTFEALRFSNGFNTYVVLYLFCFIKWISHYSPRAQSRAFDDALYCVTLNASIHAYDERDNSSSSCQSAMKWRKMRSKNQLFIIIHSQIKHFKIGFFMEQWRKMNFFILSAIVIGLFSRKLIK